MDADPPVPPGSDPTAPRPARPVRPSSLRQRLAPILLLAGLVGASSYLAKRAPRETEVTLRLDGDRDALQRLEVTFGKPGEEAGAGSQWTFVAGAPLTVRTKVSLPPATYDVVTRLDGRDGRHGISRKTMELNGNSVLVPVTITWADPSTDPPGR